MHEGSKIACHVTTAIVGKMIIINTVIIIPVAAAASSCPHGGMAPAILPAVAGWLRHVICEPHLLFRLSPAIFAWSCRPRLVLAGVAIVLAVAVVEVLQERDKHEAPAQGDVHYKP